MNYIVPSGGPYRGVLQGSLTRILGVQTIAHMGTKKRGNYVGKTESNVLKMK